MNCIHCNTETQNKKFCSRSCSNAFNNSLNPKRKANLRLCRMCQIKFHPSEIVSEHCKSCLEKKREKKEKFLRMTLKEVRERYKDTGIHRSWWYSEIRALARKMNSHRDQKCQICGYEIHVECAHIKAISEAEETMTVSELNSVKNIALLCPNHHWEFDHGLVML